MNMRRKILCAALALLGYVGGAFGFPYNTSTGVFEGVYSPNYSDFKWYWSTYADQVVSVTADVTDVDTLLFRMSDPRTGYSFLTVYNGTTTVGASNTVYSFTVASTNVPPPATYNAEILAANIDGETYTPTAVIARGVVETQWSTFSSTNIASFTPLNIYYTNYASEYDPVFTNHVAYGITAPLISLWNTAYTTSTNALAIANANTAGAAAGATAVQPAAIADFLTGDAVTNLVEELSTVAATLYGWGSVTSDVSGAKVLQRALPTNTVQTITATGATNGQYVATFITPVDQRIASISEGVANVRFHAAKGAAGAATITPELYITDSNGVKVIEYDAASSTVALTTSPTEYNIVMPILSNTVLSATQRLAVKLKATVTSGTPTIYVYSEANRNFILSIPVPSAMYATDAELDTHIVTAAPVVNAATQPSEGAKASTARTILFAGQSNAAYPDASTDVSMLAADQVTGVPSVYLYYHDWYHADVDYKGAAKVIGATVNAWGLDLEFSRVLQRATGETIYVVKYAYGATDLTDWLPGAAVVSVDEEINLYGKLTNAVALAQAEWPDMPPISAFVWTQGENDAVDDDLAADYADNFAAFYAALKGDLFDDEDVPVVITGLGKRFYDKALCTNAAQSNGVDNAPVVTAAQQAFVDAAPFRRFVRANDIDVAEEEGGNVHFSATVGGKVKIGGRIGSELISLFYPDRRIVAADVVRSGSDVTARDASLTNVAARVETLESSSTYLSPASLGYSFPFFFGPGVDGETNTVCNWWGGAYSATNFNAAYGFDDVADVGYMRFDLTGDKVQIASAISPTITNSNFSILCRYRPQSTLDASLFKILWFNYAASPAAYSSGLVLFGGHTDAINYAKPSFRLAGTSGSANGVDLDFTSATSSNVWSSLAVVVDRSTGDVNLYFNGVLDKTQNYGSAIDYSAGLYFSAAATHRFSIGGRTDATSQGAGGDISDFLLYYRALSATEVAQWHRGIQPNRTGWKPE